MPDLPRERRDRARQSLDERVIFRVDAGGSYANHGEYTENVVEWTGWGRRDDADINAAYELGVEGLREVGEVRLIIRHDTRIQAGASNYFTVGGSRFRITLVEEVGRRRYMRVAGTYAP